MVKKSELVMPYSKLKHNILNLLIKEGWIEAAKKVQPTEAQAKKSGKDSDNRFASLNIKLKFDKNGQPKISHLKRISKPGRRVYVSNQEIPIVLNFKGLAVISTSQGLLTDKQARQKKVGGEVVCEIY